MTKLRGFGAVVWHATLVLGIHRATTQEERARSAAWRGFLPEDRLILATGSRTAVILPQNALNISRTHLFWRRLLLYLIWRRKWHRSSEFIVIICWIHPDNVQRLSDHGKASLASDRLRWDWLGRRCQFIQHLRFKVFIIFRKFSIFCIIMTWISFLLTFNTSSSLI